MKELKRWEKSITSKYGIESGIDFAFIEMAKKRKIDIIDLESIETHKRFMDLMEREKM